VQTKNTQYLAKLDHLRFFAASLVVLFHTALLTRDAARPADQLPFSLVDQGHVGVQLFMVISGFIMTTMFAGREVEPLKFYINRILRIYPLLILIVSFGYFSTPDPRSTSVGIDYLMAMLPISNLYRMEYGAFGGQMWTIAVELQFYLLFPLLLRFQRQNDRRFFYAAIVGGAVALRAAQYATHGTAHSFTFFTLFGNIDLFIGGMIAADCYEAMKKRGTTVSPWFSLAALLAIIAVVALMFSAPSFFHVDYHHVTADGVSRSNKWIFWPTLQAAMWGSLLVLYLRSSGSIPASSIMAKFGKWSYSTYVWHILIIEIFKSRLLWMSPYILGFFVVLPVTLVVSYFSYLLVEQPFLRLRSAYKPTRQGPGEEKTGSICGS
jgi:peptidoglycan/LPS O-acetylase OafA/YrhL